MKRNEVKDNKRKQTHKNILIGSGDSFCVEIKRKENAISKKKMSSAQCPHDLIHFNPQNADNNDVDVLDKPNTNIVQQMVMSETASASLIATAVAKLTTSNVTTQAPSTPCKSTITMIATNKSESESQSMDEQFDTATANKNSTLTTTPLATDQQINKNQLAENALTNEIVSSMNNTDQVKMKKIK